MIDSLPHIEWGEGDRGWRWFLIALLTLTAILYASEVHHSRQLVQMHEATAYGWGQCIDLARDRVEDVRRSVDDAIAWTEERS